jgi:hypothetical protein
MRDICISELFTLNFIERLRGTGGGLSTLKQNWGALQFIQIRRFFCGVGGRPGRVGAGCLLEQTVSAIRVELVCTSLLTQMRVFTLITSTK